MKSTTETLSLRGRVESLIQTLKIFGATGTVYLDGVTPDDLSAEFPDAATSTFLDGGALDVTSVRAGSVEVKAVRFRDMTAAERQRLEAEGTPGAAEKSLRIERAG